MLGTKDIIKDADCATIMIADGNGIMVELGTIKRADIRTEKPDKDNVCGEISCCGSGSFKMSKVNRRFFKSMLKKSKTEIRGRLLYALLFDTIIDRDIDIDELSGHQYSRLLIECQLKMIKIMCDMGLMTKGEYKYNKRIINSMSLFLDRKEKSRGSFNVRANKR